LQFTKEEITKLIDQLIVRKEKDFKII